MEGDAFFADRQLIGPCADVCDLDRRECPRPDLGKRRGEAEPTVANLEIDVDLVAFAEDDSTRERSVHVRALMDGEHRQ